MTFKCSNCDSPDIKLIDDNGAEYPNTRVEFYKCLECWQEFKKVLTA